MDVQEVEMRETPAVPAADMIAWGASRRLRNAENDGWASFRRTLIGERDRNGILEAIGIDDIDEEVMRAKYAITATASTNRAKAEIALENGASAAYGRRCLPDSPWPS